MSDHADTIRRAMVKLKPDPRDRGNLHPFAPMLTAQNVRDAEAALDALLAERQQLVEQIEWIRDRAVCSGCGFDVDEGGICHYEGCDDGQMIPASDLPTALREACDTQSDQWTEHAEEIKELTAERQQAIALRETDDFLRRLSEWDMLNSYIAPSGERVYPTADAPYWQGEIAKMRGALAKLGEPC